MNQHDSSLVNQPLTTTNQAPNQSLTTIHLLSNSCRSWRPVPGWDVVRLTVGIINDLVGQGQPTNRGSWGKQLGLKLAMLRWGWAPNWLRIQMQLAMDGFSGWTLILCERSMMVDAWCHCGSSLLIAVVHCWWFLTQLSSFSNFRVATATGLTSCSLHMWLKQMFLYALHRTW